MPSCIHKLLNFSKMCFLLERGSRRRIISIYEKIGLNLRAVLKKYTNFLKKWLKNEGIVCKSSIRS